jgi:DNA polymerase-3 subunit delta
MKIAPKAVREFLAAPAKGYNGVLFYGPDAGLVRERMQLVAKALLGPQADPLSRTELSEDQLKGDPARLSDELCSSSFFGGGERKVIILRDAGDKSAKAIAGAIEVGFGDNYLIVCADELAPRSALRQMFEGQERLGAVACYKDEAMDLQSVIRGKFEAVGVNVSRDAMAYLQQHLGNDRYVTNSELDKILLYLGNDKQLSLEVAEELVGHNRDVTLDGLAMEAASGNARAVEDLLIQALREGVQPIQLLRAGQRYFQKLFTAREAMDGGKGAEQVVASLKPPLFFRHVPVFTRHLQEWPQSRIIFALNIFSSAELAVKQSAASPALITQKAFTEVTLRASRLRAA